MDSSPSSPLPTSSKAINGDKLSGQLTIKAQLGDDIRKMMIHNEDLTLNELLLMMERVFAGKISNSDELTIKYLDDDGDKITLLNDSDLNVALHFHKLLRLFVSVNGNEQINTNSTDNLNKDGNFIDAKTFRNELQDIRNSVQTILDRLQLSTNEVSTTAPTISSSTTVSNTTREFDPYKNSYQQQRSATPDSIRSNLNQSEHQTAPTVETQHVEPTNANQISSSAFQQTHMPTPHFVPSGFNNNDQQAKTNVFGPPPTTFPGIPPLPTSTAPRFPPATTPSSNTPPPSSVGQPSAFIGQQSSAPPPQQGGFYSQQQPSYQQRSPFVGFNTNNTFAPQQVAPPSSSSAPATINPSFVQPPPMASQQPYGAYPQQNTYYHPVQQYPNTSQ
jgi:hypothetical protein